MEQEPGPRGSPQLPQGPGAEREEELLLGPTAKVESCCWSFALWQDGHSARFEPRTTASKWWPHSWQMYSKMGISNRLPLVFF
jgi:hypothetical protein